MQFKTRIFIFFIFLFSLSALADDFSPDKVYRNIIAKKEINIGISREYPPLNFEAGKKGVEIAMAEKLGKFLGVTVKLIPLDFSEYIPALEQNRVDIVMAGMSRNLERAKTIWFSDAYLSVTPAVLVQKQALPETGFGDEFEERPIRTFWDLKQVSSFKMAVKENSAYHYLLREVFPSMPSVTVKTNQEGLDLLRAGKVNGFVHDSLFLQYLYRNDINLKSSYRLLQGGERTEQICMGLPFGDIILKNQVDVFISEMLRQGFIQKWLEIYNR